ncbi:MAG TPA: hypothetical protein VFV50_09285 [Bdellovibrionales bacterium]|nr:hypothetical protein [Bdellovibrionales bacterium]
MKVLIAESAVGTLAVVIGLAALHSTASAVAFAVGAGLAIINFAVLFFHLGQVFQKKQVALRTWAIVFKYLILGLIIYFIVARTDLQLFWFAAGLISLLFALAVRTAFSKQSRHSDG